MDDHADWRFQFSDIMRNEIKENPILLDNIVWSDEASFKLSDHINQHDFSYWYNGNMHLTLEQAQNQPDITVWRFLIQVLIEQLQVRSIL